MRYQHSRNQAPSRHGRKVGTEPLQGRVPAGKGAEKPGQPLGCQLSHDSPEKDTQGREKVTKTCAQDQGWWGGTLLQGKAGDPLWTGFLAPTWCL